MLFLRTTFGLALLCLFVTSTTAQPVLSSARDIAGVRVYDDLRNSRHHYYLPGKMELATEANGRPRFKLLQMRYTGTAMVGDQGEKELMSVVQVGITRRVVTATDLAAVRRALGRGAASLDPLPISGLEAHLVLPVRNAAGRPQRLGRAAELTGSGDWESRYFTVRLEADESQLLRDVLERREGGFSISYAYHAEAVNGMGLSYELVGDSAAVAGLEDEFESLAEADSTAEDHVVFAEAMPVDIDLVAWPGLVEQLDLNTQAPPAWAYLEVRCYDFTTGLRPELGMKTVEVEATGVGGGKVTLKPIRFLAGKRGQTVRQARFRYAVDIREPYRYRVTEWSAEGERKTGPWQTASGWAGLIDVTTPPEEVPYTEHTVEIEVDTAAYRRAGAKNLTVSLLFTRDNVPHREKIDYDLTKVSGMPLQLRRFFADKKTDVRYLLQVENAKGWATHSPLPVGTDNYLHLRPRPENSREPTD